MISFYSQGRPGALLIRGFRMGGLSASGYRLRRTTCGGHPRLLRCSRAYPAAGERMTQEQLLREQLAKVLDWGEAHVDFRTALQDFPLDLRGVVPPGFSHSAWEL